MSYTLPPLPYSLSALEPYISVETLTYHYEKHHAGYVNKLNELMHNDSSLTLKELMKSENAMIFNQAAQVWNHTFYWSCMSAQHKQQPNGELLKAINNKFGNLEQLISLMNAAALNQFASGWAWLVLDATNNLQIITTSNANVPTITFTALLVIDVWEHAYYIDYRNQRAKYLENFWFVVNWAFVAQNYQNAIHES